MAGKIVRYEFHGSYIYVALAFVLIFTIPLAIIHVINSTIRIDEEMENPSEFFERYKSEHRMQ